MARKEAFLDGFMEKWAAGGFFYKNLIQKPVDAVRHTIQEYNRVNNSTSFKIKKNLSRGLLLTGAGAYGLHKITGVPKPERVSDKEMPQPNM